MAKTLSSLFEGSPRRLAELMSLEARPLMEWRLDELPSILKHQWTAPIHQDLLLIDPALAKRLEGSQPAHSRRWQCFGDILHDPDAPLGALQLLMDYAKASWTHGQRPMPQAIAQVLYYACMARAWTQYQQIIGGLEEQHMRRGFEWALALPWLDRPIRQIFVDAKQSLPGPQGKSSGRTEKMPENALLA